MSEKEKHKVKPRQRTLIRLLLVLIIITALISAGRYLLSAKGAQIVFIAPDENGIDQIWIASLNDPEHPRQLTFHERTDFRITREVAFVSRPQAHNGVLVANGVIVYININTEQTEIWFFDTQTNHHELIETRVDSYCSNLMLHPNGEWIAYEEYLRLNNDPGLGGMYRVSITVENLVTHEQRVIFEDNEMRGEYSSNHLVSWMPGTTSLAFLQFDEGSSLPILNVYDMVENQIIDRREFYASGGETIFSDDGLHFVQHQDHYVGMDLTFLVNDFNNPENILFNFIEPDDIGDLIMTYFHDWHPDNETMLISNVWYQLDTDNQVHHLLLYNIATRSSNVLSIREDVLYTAASFSGNASQILVGLQNIDTYESQIMLYDMETREEIALPLFGSNPQWVNGGR